MLSPLQVQVAQIVASLPEAEGFALAGGAALITRGEIHRTTRDLDFFGLSGGDVDRLVPAVELALQQAGMSVERVLHNPGFTRLIVTANADRTELDLGSDARLFPLDQTSGVPTLAGEELAVDKVLAVFGRAEPRDFMDLAARADHYGLDRLFALAAEKDHGFDLEVFAQMAGRFVRLPRDEFPIGNGDYEVLRHKVEKWISRARVLALTGQQLDGTKRDRGPDRGLGL